MRKVYFSVLAILMLVACSESERATEQQAAGNQTPTTHTAVDTAKARQDLNALADEIHNLFKKKDIAFVDKHMAKDGIYLGTDPNEILNFNDFRAYQEQMLGDTAVRIPDYKIERREIVINGASAVIIDQYFFPDLSEKMMIRNISHARHEDGRWMVDMFSWNFIPRNEDVEKINKAL
ncbi:nuclear transport factor 2 family protein [uncultured Pontibacter sp.]|uniref:nuclear transport factor 2 family protein n=1 Tax=uncultured Pontibacter sp. TaxID=453356 RepID=UPI002639168E|nr:nuclear transport factor 2 family protein [uncultured Pontibacter sp.]